MRIIHTADWHIGQTLRGYQREHEQRAVLNELISIVTEREADALIVAGDVFDSQNPSGESQRLFYETLLKLHRARPRMQIVITAGNHDAPGRLEAPRALLANIGVSVTGNVSRVNGKIDAGRHLVALRSASGEIEAHVLAVSHPTAACLPILPKVDGVEASPAERTRALYSDLIEAARPNASGLPLIVTGHLHVAGGIESEGAERRILVGGQHAVPPDIFPAEAAYVALGHLHKAQTFKGDRVRYCGSLLPLSATEQPYRHGVTLLNLDSSGVSSIEHIEVRRPVSFLRVPGVGEARLDELGDHLGSLDLDQALPVELQPFVQVRLSRDGLGSGFRAEADRIAEQFPVRLVDLRLSARTEKAEGENCSQAIIRLADRVPEELFRDAFQSAHGLEPNSRHLEIFHRAFAEAGEEV